MKVLIEGMQWELKTQMAEVEAQAGCGGSADRINAAERVKSQRINGFMSLVMFHRQFEAAAGHNNCVTQVKATHLPAVLQGKALIFN
jgi:hypothetical protein